MQENFQMDTQVIEPKNLCSVKTMHSLYMHVNAYIDV